MSNQKFKIWLPAVKKMTHALSIYDWVQGGFNGNLSNGDIFLQYTGLSDKNGREIYEGDIFRLEFSEKFDLYGRSTGPQISWTIQEVIFSEGQFKAVIHKEFNSHFGKLPSEPKPIQFEVFKKLADHYEVIGNVFENPELLG